MKQRIQQHSLTEKEIPTLSGGLPLLGHAINFRNNPVEMLAKGYTEHGPVFKFNVTGKTFVTFAGPDAHKAYFRAPDNQLSQKEVYGFTIPIFGKGVAYDATPEVMAEQIDLLRPALKHSQLSTYIELMKVEINQQLDKLGDTGKVEITALTEEVTLKIACRCLLGEEVRNELFNGFSDLYRDLQGGINLIGFMAPKLPIPAHIRRDNARRKVSKLMSKIIKKRKDEKIESDDFLNVLINAKYKSGRRLTHDEIAGLLLTVLFAGQHTSGALASWCVSELARRADYLTKIRQEIDNVYSDIPVVTLENLKEQNILERFIRETERLHPPLAVLVRMVLRDMEYDGFTIPAGSLAMISPAFSHRMADVFENPESFNPERYLDENGEDKIAQNTLISFGGGHHMCLGFSFAYLMLKVILSTLVSRYDIELCSDFPKTNFSHWVATPKEKIWITYKSRKPHRAWS